MIIYLHTSAISSPPATPGELRLDQRQLHLPAQNAHDGAVDPWDAKEDKLDAVELMDTGVTDLRQGAPIPTLRTSYSPRHHKRRRGPAQCDPPISRRAGGGSATPTWRMPRKPSTKSLNIAARRCADDRHPPRSDPDHGRRLAATWDEVDSQSA